MQFAPHIIQISKTHLVLSIVGSTRITQIQTTKIIIIIIIMEKQTLNIGTTLSRSQQKQINGGSATCSSDLGCWVENNSCYTKK